MHGYEFFHILFRFSSIEPFKPYPSSAIVGLHVACYGEAAIIIANAPSLLLSFVYLSYNNDFTRVQMAREWGSFSKRLRHLRVTEPKGMQKST